MRGRNSIFITGYSGFIGRNIQKYFENLYTFTLYLKEGSIEINEDVVLHIAGKAHDLKNIDNPDVYYESNTQLTKLIFDKFMESNATVFISLSSVKAVADESKVPLTEESVPRPLTHYGKSKKYAEDYIFNSPFPDNKRVYVLRPCMIHGPGNKGNLNLLYKLVSKGIPWPLGAFENARSFCSIENLMFIFKELMEREDIPSGVYNVSDDTPLSTNDVISVLAESQNKKISVWKISKRLIHTFAKLGNFLDLPLNEERLRKLTDSYVVSNYKIKSAIGKPLPVSSRNGLLKTFNSFKINDTSF